MTETAPPSLRPYQRQAVTRVVEHFRATDDPAVVVLPTGSGKSLVIAELARLARGRVLVLGARAGRAEPRQVPGLWP